MQDITRCKEHMRRNKGWSVWYWINMEQVAGPLKVAIRLSCRKKKKSLQWRELYGFVENRGIFLKPLWLFFCPLLHKLLTTFSIPLYPYLLKIGQSNYCKLTPPFLPRSPLLIKEQSSLSVGVITENTREGNGISKGS